MTDEATYPLGRMRPRIILVDDHESLLHSLPFVIECRIPGSEVQAFPTWATALASLSREPSVVVMNARVWGADDWGPLEEMHSRHPGVPVVLLLGHADRTVVARGFALGAYDVLLTPFDGEDLMRTLMLALEVHRLDREARAVERARDRLAAKELALTQLLLNVSGHPVAFSNPALCDRVMKARTGRSRTQGALTVSLQRVATSRRRLQGQIEERESRLRLAYEAARERALCRLS